MKRGLLIVIVVVACWSYCYAGEHGRQPTFGYIGTKTASPKSTLMQITELDKRIATIEASGKIGGFREVLEIIKEQQEILKVCYSMALPSTRSGQQTRVRPASFAWQSGGIEDRLEALEKAVEEISDPYAYDSLASNIRELKRLPEAIFGFGGLPIVQTESIEDRIDNLERKIRGY